MIDNDAGYNPGRMFRWTLGLSFVFYVLLLGAVKWWMA